MLLQVDGLTAGYGKVDVLHEVSFHVNEGEILTIIGANGAGKTTLLNTLAGLLKPRDGGITFEGEDISGRSPEAIMRRGLSLVMQGRSVFPFMTVLENLEMGAYTIRDRSTIRSRLERVYALFPILKERTGQLAGTLSGGEQKMLELARALMLEPKLLMLDEPSLGLAPMVVHYLFQKMSELNSLGATIVLVEQNAYKALETAHRGYVMELGHIRMEGISKDLRENGSVKKHFLGG